ncbi:hypothetical protein OF83DRAFT_1167495 [Amylostereum chailletii]|nr:hypothetical protein OF83DRAFT_1167495 [Amylostereum chailletii]
MSLRPVHEFSTTKSPSPAYSDLSAQDHDRPRSAPSPHAYGKGDYNELYQYPPPSYSYGPKLPPLRAFLKQEGIPSGLQSSDERSRDCADISTSHAEAREAAFQRTLRAVSSRSVRLNIHDLVVFIVSYILAGLPLLKSVTIPMFDTVPRIALLTRAPKEFVGIAHRPGMYGEADCRSIPFSPALPSDLVRKPQMQKSTHSTAPRPSSSSRSSLVSKKRKDSDIDELEDDEAGSEAEIDGQLTSRLDGLSTNSPCPPANHRLKEYSGDEDYRGIETIPKVKRRSRSPAKEYYNDLGVKLEVRELAIKYDPKAWLRHIAESDNKGKWHCTWQTMRNGVPATCSYSAKKHLVKRHIEATHMNIKRFECSWCFKTFTQRSNVSGCHLNTHSGEAPHECDYCDERFKDPSKRHKHMARHHMYETKKKKKRMEQARLEVASVALLNEDRVPH